MRHITRLSVIAGSIRGAVRLMLIGVALCASSYWLSAAPAEWRTGQGFRSLSVSVSSAARPGFTWQEAQNTGIRFTNQLSQDRFTTNQIYLSGSGVAAGDVDGDGWCDLYFCAIQGENVLYRNLGNWRFENVTAAANVGCRGLDSTGAAMADLDGDGDLDLIVNSVAQGTRIFLNDGRGRFQQSQVLNPERSGMSIALADFDGNGTLDLYISNYRTRALRDLPGTTFKIRKINGAPVVVEVNGRPATDPDLLGRFTVSASNTIIENGEPDALYRNDGQGHFTPVSFTDGTFLDEGGHPLQNPPYDWGLGAAFRDLNGDGWPDLYVCNDFDSPDRIWINDGHGKFRAIAELALRNQPKFSMGVDFADINRDGFDDIFVVEMLSRSHSVRLTRADRSMEGSGIGQFRNRPQLTRNTLQLNRGDGTYAEVAYLAGLEATGWSWTPAFLDIDLDGYEDLLVTTGHGRDDMHADHGMRIDALKRSRSLTPLQHLELRKATPPVIAPQAAYKNLGNLHFQEMGAAWGLGQTGICHGLCLADLDNDGDMDVAINRLNDVAAVYRNDATAPRIGVRLKGSGKNTAGIGARIIVRGGAVPLQSQEMQAGSRYLSGDQAMRVFAGPTSEQLAQIEVRWPGGKTSRLEQVSGNNVYEIFEITSHDPRSSNISNSVPLFEERTLGVAHHEDPFDDYARQPLLPKKLSQLGPGVGWIDLDGDGWDDIVMGSGKGGSPSVLLNTRNGGFKREQTPLYEAAAPRDLAGLCALPEAGANRLLVGVANYEDGNTENGPVMEYVRGHSTPSMTLPVQESSCGPLALSDVDGDGDLDLFVGGRVVAGRYPLAPASTLWRNENGRWILDEANAKLLANVGLVSGAVWTDLDGDGRSDLILACEWGPIRVLRNENGILRDVTARMGLEAKLGWWNGISVGDFDEDGRMDLIASNWGLNHKYRVTSKHGPRLYAGDPSGVGRIETLESYYDETLNMWVPERDLLAVARHLPFVRESFTELAHYARSGMDEIFGDRIKTFQTWEANTLESLLLLNRGDHFESVALPVEAQLSPAFGIAVADLNGDGHEDAILSQNFFNTQGQTSRNDAGRGLVLLGDGKGGFRTLPAVESGIAVYGEGRGVAAGDYDQDGRVDLLMAQNGGELKLYRNQRARLGLRVRLQGGKSNPAGVGARMRLEANGAWGPVREVHAGSGYWSQDSFVQVLCSQQAPTRLEIRWPKGATSVVPIAADQHGLVVKAPPQE